VISHRASHYPKPRKRDIGEGPTYLLGIRKVCLAPSPNLLTKFQWRNTDRDVEYRVSADTTIGSPVRYLSVPEGLHGHRGTDASLHRKTILVVDDDPSMRLIWVRTLRAEGFTALEAEGSSESLKILTICQEPIDLLLTDLMLSPPGFQMTSTEDSYTRVHGHEVIRTYPGNEEDVPRDPDVGPV